MTATWIRQIAKGVLYAILLLVVALLILAAAARNIFILQAPFHLLCGWAIHGWKALPPFFEKWQAAVLPAGCLLLAAALGHRFICRWIEAKRPALDWRIRHTAAAFSLILLCSAAAIATSGIVHQFFWLGQGKILRDSRRVEIVYAMSNARQLGLYLFEFHDANGHYPRSFDELDARAELIRFTPDGSGVTEPFVLLRPGATDIGSAEDPIFVSPLLYGGTKYVVGFGDASVRRINASQLPEILDAAKLPKKTTPDE